MSQLPTYSPELSMTREEKRDYQVLQDPLLKMPPEDAAGEVLRAVRKDRSGIEDQLERLTRIIVALNNKIKHN